MTLRCDNVSPEKNFVNPEFAVGVFDRPNIPTYILRADATGQRGASVTATSATQAHTRVLESQNWSTEQIAEEQGENFLFDCIKGSSKPW